MPPTCCYGLAYPLHNLSKTKTMYVKNEALEDLLDNMNSAVYVEQQMVQRYGACEFLRPTSSWARRRFIPQPRIEYGGIDGFLDEFYIEPTHRARQG